jgi:hypothetical protein
MATDGTSESEARRRGVRRTVAVLVVIVIGLYGWFIFKGVSGALQQ